MRHETRDTRHEEYEMRVNIRVDDLGFKILSVIGVIGVGLALGLGLGLRFSSNQSNSSKNITLIDEDDVSVTVVMTNITSNVTSISTNSTTNSSLISTPSGDENNGNRTDGEELSTKLPNLNGSSARIPTFQPTLTPTVTPGSRNRSANPTYSPTSKNNEGENQISDSPSESPSNLPEHTTTSFMSVTDIRRIIGEITEERYLSDKNKPHSRALEFMIGPNTTIPSNSAKEIVLQRYILSLLYFSTGGPSWTHQHNFLSPQNECEWKSSKNEGILSGVQECESGKIKKLSLEGVLMIGRIPSELGYLSTLTSLNFHENNLEGPIPSSFENLKSLEFVKINENFLSGSVSSLCDAWQDNIKVFHVDKDQIACSCCSCCPYDS